MHTETNEKEFQDFFLRNVPVPLHRRWKKLSSYMGKGMRDVAIEALEAYVSTLEGRLYNEGAKEQLNTILTAGLDEGYDNPSEDDGDNESDNEDEV